MSAPGVPEILLNITPLMTTLNQTPLTALPQELQQLIQNLVGVAYVTIGGFFGIFIISTILRWWQGQQLKKKFKLILEKLDRIERKVSKKKLK